MSCGPSSAMRDLADQIDQANDALDAAINDSPLGKLASLKEEAEAKVNAMMDKLEAAIPGAIGGFVDKAFEDLPMGDQMKEVAGLIALGYLQKDLVENKIDVMKAKYSNLDVDIDNVADLLRSGAADIDDLCKLLPNVSTQGVNLIVKGIPTSFPNVDPVAMVKKGDIPKLPDIGKVFLDVEVEAKDQADDFLSLELPRFNL